MSATWNHSRKGILSPASHTLSNMPDVSDFCSRGLNCLLDDSQTLTLFPVPLPTGGWHSQACLMAHSMISTRAVSWRSVRAKNRRHGKLPTTCPIDWGLGEVILHRSKMMLWTTFLQLILEQKYEIWISTPSPSSPGTGSSSSRLIIVSQSFNSSDAQSHKLSTK